jgi:methionyl aminopeptidase
MIYIKSDDELELMRKAGRIAALAREAAAECIKPGVTTHSIDSTVKRVIKSHGAIPSFLGYAGFPASACISINDEVIHGIPNKNRILRAGDIVSIDLGACINGYTGDNAATFACGDISAEAKRLIETTEQSLYEGIKKAVSGSRLGDVGSAIQSYCEERGYGVVREYTGHGIGSALHEDPAVPNYGTPGRGIRLVPGMTIAIEPMINEGKASVKTLSDGWTVKTTDGKLSAHFEHTIAITSSGPLIMTKLK